ncbi:MAG TPA: inosine/xanthosine triphosphatase [Candidatus Paceibacterota bacterium]
MKINVGSKNNIKVSAVKEALDLYQDFKNAAVEGMSIQSAVSEQPKSMEETVRGALHRAKIVFQNCDYSFGIESGLMQVPNTKTGYMDFTVCAIYDGQRFHLGLSPALECPPIVIQRVFADNLDLDGALHQSGITQNQDIGSAEGMIGLLTKGRITRKDYTKQAIMMAMIHLENKEYY